MPKHTHTHTRACMHMHACIPHVFQCRLQHLFIRLRIPLSQLRLDVHLASSFASPEESALANSIRGAHRNDREETDADEEGKVQLPTLLRERQFTRRFSANRRMLLLIIYTHGATATPCSCICPCSPDFPSAPCRHHRPRPCRTMGCIYEHVHIRVASRSSTPADTSAQPPSCATRRKVGGEEISFVVHRVSCVYYTTSDEITRPQNTGNPSLVFLGKTESVNKFACLLSTLGFYDTILQSMLFT